MVTNEQIETIQKVANKVHHKYVFGYFTDEDIKQQAILFGIEAVEKSWDGIRPLENFLSVLIPNKLKNFKRNNYFRLGASEKNVRRSINNKSKKSLMEPVELFDFDLVTESSTLDKMIYDEQFKIIYKEMSYFMKSDLKRMIGGVKIPKKRRAEVEQFIKGFL